MLQLNPTCDWSLSDISPHSSCWTKYSAFCVLCTYLTGIKMDETHGKEKGTGELRAIEGVYEIDRRSTPLTANL